MTRKTEAVEAATAALPPTPTPEQMASYTKRRLDDSSRHWLRENLMDVLFKEKQKANYAAARELVPAILEHIHGAARMKLWNAVPVDMLHRYHRDNEVYAQLSVEQQGRVRKAYGGDPSSWAFRFASSADGMYLPSLGNDASRDTLPAAIGDKVATLLAEQLVRNKQRDALNNQLYSVLKGCRTLAAAVSAVPDLFTLLGPEKLDSIVEPTAKPQPVVAKTVSCLIGAVLGVQREGCTDTGAIAA